MKFSTKLKILIGVYKLPDNTEEFFEIKKEYDRLCENYDTLQQERRDQWLSYCEWCDVVTDRYRNQIDALLEANTSLAENVRTLCKAFKKISADDSVKNK